MKNGKRKTVGILAVILLAISLLCSGCAKKEEPKAPYKIGGIFAITGANSFLGEPERNSMELLAEQINARGGINGRPIELVIYDTEGDATKAVLNANKLIEKDNVLAIVGPSLSGTTLGVVPIVEKAQGTGATHFLCSLGKNHHAGKKVGLQNTANRCDGGGQNI